MRQAELEARRGFDRAQHPQERLRHDLGTQLHPLEGELVPGNDRVDVTAHSQAEEWPHHTLPRAGGAPTCPGQSADIAVPASVRRSMLTGWQPWLKSTASGVPEKLSIRIDMQAAVDRPVAPHPIEAEPPNCALSGTDPNGVECGDGLGATAAHWAGMRST